MDVRSEWTLVPVSGGALDCFRAEPRQRGPFPGVVVVMEVFGVNDHMQRMTQRIAGEGYVCLCPDLFHGQEKRGFDYTDVGTALEAAKVLDGDVILSDIAACTRFLSGHAPSGGRKTGIIGFCMGGRIAFEAACRPDVVPSIDAAISFYGSGLAKGGDPPLGRVPKLRVPMLCVFGAEDPLVPADEVEAIRNALDATATGSDVIVYAGAGHGFMCDARPSYHKESAEDAFERLRWWFGTYLLA
jgi:carboxymethylenebutenolidase